MLLLLVLGSDMVPFEAGRAGLFCTAGGVARQQLGVLLSCQRKNPES